MTEPMDRRRALALAVMACEDVAARAPDVGDWTAAGLVIRCMLAELQGPAGPWVTYREGGQRPGRRNGRGAAGGETA